MDPRQAPRQRHHHPFEHHNDIPPWAHTLNDNLELIWYVLELVLEGQTEMARTHAEILAAVQTATTKVDGMRETLAGLAEGHADIKQEIADLKAQIAAGQTPTPEDLSDLDTAVDSLGKTIDGAAAAIDAGTPPAPEGNVAE